MNSNKILPHTSNPWCSLFFFFYIDPSWFFVHPKNHYIFLIGCDWLWLFTFSNQIRYQLGNNENNEENEGNITAECREDIIYQYESWKDDPAERSRRIALWWKHIIVTLKIKIPAFAEAFRTVALTQVSSALIERMFSHLSKVVNTSSENQIERTIECCLIFEVNKAINSVWTLCNVI